MRRLMVLLVFALVASVVLVVPALAEPTQPVLRSDDAVVPTVPDDTDGRTGLANLDPLGLLHEYAEISYFSRGTDTLQVWACNSSRTAAQYVADLNRDIVPYYRWLSGGAYTPRFEAGGVGCWFGGSNPTTVQPAQARGIGAIFIDPAYPGGYAGPGAYCVQSWSRCEGATWLDISRTGVMEYHPHVIAHEIGHMISWPHVFSGRDGTWEYDEPMDVMSGNLGANGYTNPTPFATAAINRYAAGWFGPDQVVIHASGSRTIDLLTPGTGIQMAVIRDTGGRYFVLTPRVRSTYDQIPAHWQGLTVHRVTPHVFDRESNDNVLGFRAVTQWPNTSYDIGFDGSKTLDHIIRPGTSRNVGGVTVKVESSINRGFRVSLSGNAVGGGSNHTGCDPVAGFTDVCATNTFAADIEWLATEGITRGCNPPTNTRYCPDAPVTRAQMATFLKRALDLPDATGSGFTDVTTTNPHRDDIAALAAAGITKGCNPPANTRYCPDAPVTRAQMASFLKRALDLPAAGTGNFTDVAANNAHRDDIAALAAADITKGCNPPANNRFCPTQSVTRAQMAAFLHRALG